MAKAKYPYLLSVAGLVLVALAGLYNLIVALSFRRAFAIRARALLTANMTRAPATRVFMAYRPFPGTGFVLSSFVTIIGFVMIFLGLIWLGVLIFREPSSSNKP